MFRIIGQYVYTPETIVFNNLIDTKKDYINNWETSASNSWLNNYIVSNKTDSQLVDAFTLLGLECTVEKSLKKRYKRERAIKIYFGGMG